MKRSSLSSVLPWLVLLYLALACLHCGGVAPAVTQSQDLPAPTLEELKNATYSGLEIPQGTVTLKDGNWIGKPFVEGGASRPEVYFVRDFRLVGDVDRDERDEAVVLLGENSGGSGQHIYLAVVERQGGTLRNVATQLLGDRIQLREARIDAGRIFLDLVQAGKEDAACCPGELITRGWELRPEGLIELAVPGKPDRLSMEAIAGTEWVLRAWDIDEPALEESEVTLLFQDGRFSGRSGCNRYFASVKPGDMPGDLYVGPAGSTRMACPEPAMTVETRFLEQLGQVEKFGFMVGQLMLSYQKENSRGVMLFDPIK